MTASSRYSRAISSEVGDIERRLQVLQNGIEKLGTRASSNARDTADGLSEAVASALSSWADRFRHGASSLGDQSTAFGKDAARYGTAALSQISKETEQRPLIAIAVALGVGILIGMATRKRSSPESDSRGRPANGAKGPVFHRRWKCSPDGQAHFSIARAASIHPDSRVASLRKYFDGCYFHSLSALTRWALGTAGL